MSAFGTGLARGKKYGSWALVQVTKHGEKVVITAGAKRLMIEIRYPPSDRIYSIRKDPPTALLGEGKMTEAVVELLRPPRA